MFNIIFTDGYIMTLEDFDYWGVYIITPITYIGELYTLARLMKPELKNIVVYMGNSHIEILSEYLSILNFNLDYSDNSGLTQETFQCVKGISFYNYFK